MSVEFRRFASPDRAENALFSELERHLTQAPNGGHNGSGPYVIMLPGGSTPLRVYGRLRNTPTLRVDPAAHLVLSDDRHVPPDSADSNYRYIRAMAKSVGIPDDRVTHVHTDQPLAQSAEGYDDALARLHERDATFALAILGIGGDGHTASLFTSAAVPLPADTGEREAPHRFALAVPGTGGFDRVSATPEFILGFQRLLFFATGEGKRDILYRIARHPEEYPSGRLMLQHDRAEIWTDQGYIYE